MRKIIFATSLLLATVCDAQIAELGTWNMLDGFYKIKKNYTGWIEVQTRSQQVINNFYHYQIKGGLLYNIPKTDYNLFVGIGRYATYDATGNFKLPLSASETRLWEQLAINNQYSHIKIEHRIRLEQRWINNDYKARFRYRLNPIIMLNHASMLPHTVFISCFDEIFLSNVFPRFELNRYYWGGGVQLNKKLAIQLGILHESNFDKTGKETNRNYLQSTLQVTIDNKTFLHHHTMNENEKSN